jgi:deazaflavin-dependent oxidoreductase (nitroreductase family)
MDTLKDRLARYRQIKLSVVGRKSGKTITNPVWFVAEGEKLYLLPVHGSDTQWYQNVLKNPKTHVDARGAEAELRAESIPRPSQDELLGTFRLRFFEGERDACESLWLIED